MQERRNLAEIRESTAAVFGDAVIIPAVGLPLEATAASVVSQANVLGLCVTRATQPLGGVSPTGCARAQ